MFRFDKARTPRNQDASNTSSQADLSIDYANYLLDIQEGKMHILKEHHRRNSSKPRLFKGGAQKQKIDFYDLRDNGGAEIETQRIQAQIKKTENVDK